jgi:hypothetical protein
MENISPEGSSYLKCPPPGKFLPDNSILFVNFPRNFFSRTILGENFFLAHFHLRKIFFILKHASDLLLIGKAFLQISPQPPPSRKLFPQIIPSGKFTS